jgi:Lon protease-like protein
VSQTIERFPLFPLGLVLLPGEKVPLHIFEDRYKQMIGECLDEEREFGIIWLSDEALEDVGCAARIIRVLERFEDGRMNIVVEGTTPFRLERRIGELAYPAGDVELLDDEPDEDDAALERARKSYADLVEQVTDTRPEPEALAELDAYGMAATLDIAASAKQALLELRSEPARLGQLEALFDEALKRIRTATRVAEQASGNGHLKPGDQHGPGV